MKNLASSTLLLATLLFTASCKKEADPQPAPAVAPVQAAAINMRFDAYATIASPAETKSLSLLATKPAGQLLSDRLTMHFDNRNFVNRVSDAVDFIIPKGRQKAGLIGTYTISSQPDAGVGDVQASYYRPSDGGDMRPNYFSSNSNTVDGNLVITSYDATRKLISGSYTLTVKRMKDPYTFIGTDSATDPRREGDVNVEGTFEEVPLQ